MKSIKVSIFPIVFSMFLFLGKTLAFAEETEEFELKPTVPDESKLTEWINNTINNLPTYIAIIAFIMIFAFMFYVLLKSLNPFTDDQEGKFKEGKDWFTKAGILIIAPIILFIAIAVIYSAFGFQSPWSALNSFDITTILPNF